MFYIGIDLGGTNLRGGAVAEEGNIIQYSQEPTFAEQGVNCVIANIITLIGSLITSQHPSRLKGIGIGCPGIIELEKGVVHVSPNLPGWKDVPLKKLLEEQINVPVYVENDANTIAYGEKCHGAGRNASSLICLTLGTGVGGGIILDEKIWHGYLGMAGEIGHMTIIHDGIKCNCGNRGCLEAYASASGLVKQAIDLINTGRESLVKHSIDSGAELTAEMIYKAALDGDLLARQVLNQTGKYLGIGIASLINLLNPEMIIIGGGMANAWEMFYPSMIQEIRERAFDIPFSSTKIARAQLGNDAGILGAAALIARDLSE